MFEALSITFSLLLALLLIEVPRIRSYSKRQRRIFLWAQKAETFQHWHGCDFKTNRLKQFPKFKYISKKGGCSNLFEGYWKGHLIVGYEGIGYSVVILSSEMPLKPLYIRPENSQDKIAGAMRKTDIEMESPEFNRRFFITADDRKWASDILHPRMMQYLLARPDYEIEMGENFIAVVCGVDLDSDIIEPMMDYVCGLYDQLPDFLLEKKHYPCRKQ